MWFPYKTPCWFPAGWFNHNNMWSTLPRPGAETVSLPRRVWFHLQLPPLLPSWLCADEGRDSTSVSGGELESSGIEGTTRDYLLGLACCSPRFPMTFKKGQVLARLGSTFKQVWVGGGWGHLGQSTPCWVVASLSVCPVWHNGPGNNWSVSRVLANSMFCINFSVLLLFLTRTLTLSSN